MRLLIGTLLLSATIFMAQDPVDSHDWINRGVAEFKSGNYTQAVADFQRAVQSDSSNLNAHLYLGTAWMQQFIPGADSAGNRALAASAEQEFRKVLDLDSNNGPAMRSLATLNLDQKKWDEAQSWYEKLLALEPSNSEAWYSMGFIAWSRWYPSFMQARASVGMKPADPGPMPPGAEKADLKTRFEPVLDGGIHDLQQALAIDPQYDDAMAYLNLLIREKADLRDNQADYQQDIAEANAWVDKAMATRKARLREQTVPALGIVATGPPAPPPPPPPPPPGAPQQPDRIRVAGNVQSAQLIQRVDPVYPSLARQAGVEGTVKLDVLIGTEGHVLNVMVLEGAPLLVQAAIDAVRQWVYRPTLLNGQPIAVQTTVNVEFHAN